MNIKSLILSALVTSILGGFLGFSVDRITQYSRGQLVYENFLYDNIRKEYIIVGSILGLIFGAGITAMKQERISNQAESNQQNPSENGHGKISGKN